MADDADIGKPRAEVCVPKLQELNRLVTVTALAGALSESSVEAHTCVVVMDKGMKLSEAMKWNEFCRARKIGFIFANVYGACGFVFDDFGDAFGVRDMNG